MSRASGSQSSGFSVGIESRPELGTTVDPKKSRKMPQYKGVEPTVPQFWDKRAETYAAV